MLTHGQVVHSLTSQSNFTSNTAGITGAGGRPGEKGDRSGGGALFVYENSYVMMVGGMCKRSKMLGHSANISGSSQFLWANGSVV